MSENETEGVAHAGESAADCKRTAAESTDYAARRSTLEKIKNLPTPVGLTLVGFGIAGILLPGPMGTPLLVAGGLVLAPRTFNKVEKYFERRFPQFHRAGLAIVERFIDDLEKRYPSDGPTNG